MFIPCAKRFAASAVVFFLPVAPDLAQSADQAKAALAQGNYRQAESLYRNAIKASPERTDLRTSLGVVLQSEGHASEAIGEFRAALRLRADDRTYALLARELCRTRAFTEVVPMLDRIERQNSSQPELLALVAPCFLALGKPVDSVELYTRLLSLPGGDTDANQVQLIRSYVASTKFFGERLAKTPDSAEYLAAIEKARTAGTTSARSAFPLAARRSSSFKPDLTYLQAAKVWRQHPFDTAMIYQMQALSGEGVITAFEAASEHFPESPYLQQFRAEMLADQGREPEAVELLEGVAQQHPEMGALHYDLGMLFRNHGQWEKAQAEFQQQVATDPEDEAAAARLSEALLSQSKYNELVQSMSAWVADRPMPLWTALDLATANEKLGHAAKAIRTLQTAERLAPEDRSVHYRLLRLYAQTGDAAAATRERILFNEAEQQKRLTPPIGR